MDETYAVQMAILRELWTDEVEDEEVRSTYDYVINLRKRLEHTCELAMKNFQKVQGKQKVYYDRQAKPCSFKVGDKVLLLLPPIAISYYYNGGDRSR